jgi:hypothetical protein
MLPDGNTDLVVSHPLDHEGCGEGTFSQFAAAIPLDQSDDFF